MLLRVAFLRLLAFASELVLLTMRLFVLGRAIHSLAALVAAKSLCKTGFIAQSALCILPVGFWRLAVPCMSLKVKLLMRHGAVISNLTNSTRIFCLHQAKLAEAFRHIFTGKVNKHGSEVVNLRVHLLILLVSLDGFRLKALNLLQPERIVDSSSQLLRCFDQPHDDLVCLKLREAIMLGFVFFPASI